MASLAFVRPQLEDAFALQLAERTCFTAATVYSTVLLLSLAAVVKCCAAVAAASLTPRLAMLASVACVSAAAHARALNVVARPSKAWKHESIKVTTALVGVTTCMMAGILSHKDELYLKDPAVIVCVRGWSLLAEGYRLNVALSLHAIQMVCFIFQEIDMCLGAQWDLSTSLRTAASHALMLLAVGKALPILLAVYTEGHARLHFLQIRGLPLSNLGAFWRACTRWLPGMRK